MHDFQQDNVDSLPLYSVFQQSDSSKEFAEIVEMLRRIFKPSTLDFESATWEMYYLMINPKRIYKSNYYTHKLQSSRTSFARDDPSFLILLNGMLIISVFAWGLTYSPGVFQILKLYFFMVIVNFYIVGFIISTIEKILVNRLLTIYEEDTYNQQGVEFLKWNFCFDVHCNSFVIIWCLLYFVQFIWMPLILNKNSLFAIFLGNSLYFCAFGYYCLMTFHGLYSLPFITNGTQFSSFANQRSRTPAALLYDIFVIIIVPFLFISWFLSIFLRFDVASIMFHLYFT